jgi:hypothetical protein
MKKKLLVGLAAGLLFSMVGMAEATILTFDDIPGASQNGHGSIGSYGGLNFGSDYNMSPMDWIDTVDSYWNYGSVSGDFTMLNNYGGNAIITSAQDFTFDGVYARIWGAGTRYDVSIMGYNNGNLVWSSSGLTLNTNWNYFAGSSANLDELRLNFGNCFLVDNLSINETAPVPEPATMLLMGTGIAGLIAARRRKKA